MKLMKSVVAVVGLVVVSLVALPARVDACSCAVMDVPNARRAAALVFEGTLIRMEQATEGTARGTFRVRRVWKGNVGREITLNVPPTMSMCPPHFEEGQTYIVYAEPGPRVGACARWGAGAMLEQERRALGNPVRTYRRRPPPPG